LLTVKDGDVADEADRFTFSGFRNLFRDFFFGFLELAEFYLDEFVIFQGKVN